MKKLLTVVWMSSLLLLTFLAAWPADAQSPEERYEEYITPETRAIMERFEQAEREAQEAFICSRRKGMVDCPDVYQKFTKSIKIARRTQSMGY